MVMRTLAEVLLEAKPKKDPRKEDSPKPKKKGRPPGRKPRKKADVAALEEFVAKLQRLEELLEAKKEYDRIQRQLKQGRHGQGRVLDLMREYFGNAFRDVGDAYDEALEAVLRLEKIAVQMISKERKKPHPARVMELLLEDADPVVQEAIARAEKLADENPTMQFREEWKLLDIAEAYGYCRDKQLLSEGMVDWLKTKGKKLLGSLHGVTSWFRSKATPQLSSIATELEGMAKLKGIEKAVDIAGRRGSVRHMTHLGPYR